MGIAPLLLQAGPGWDAGDFMFIGALFLIFYFLMIRPQTKRQKEHDAMLESIQKGDRVVTTGGLHGEVVGSSDEVLTLDVGAQKGQLKVKVDRARVERKVEKKGSAE